MAIKLRKSGLSYSQIRDRLSVSKSSLSLWLRDLPLSDHRLRALRDNSQVRIEKSRETKRKKKEQRRTKVFDKVSLDIQKSQDPFFVSGFYLYWGEGTKSSEYTIAFTNSDSSMIQAFIEWTRLLGVDKTLLKIKLNLYADQDENDMKKLWSKVTGVPLGNFYKTYTKSSLLARRSYKGLFSHGTCAVMYHNRDVYEYVLEGIKYLQKKHGLPGSH